MNLKLFKSKLKNYESRKIHNIREMLEYSSALFAKRAAFYEKTESGKYRSHTYGSFYRDVNALGVAFMQRGLDGKRIILIGENSYAWCVTYMATLCGMGVIVPADKDISADELADIAKLSGAGAIVFSEGCREKAQGAGKRIQKFSFDEIMELCADENQYPLSEYSAFRKISIDADAPCTLIFGAGSASSGKIVMLSQRNLCFGIENLAKAVNLTPDDTMLSVLPLHYLYECTLDFLFPISCGASVAFSEGVRSLIKNMKEIRPTKIVCAPRLIETLYSRIWSNIRKKGIEEKVKKVIKTTNLVKPEKARMAAKRKMFADIHEAMGGRLELLISGGSSIDPQIIKGMRDFGFCVLQSYGLSECGAIAAINPDKAPKDSSAGRVLPDGEFKISCPAADGIGEICYRGDNVMLGYYKNPEATADIKKNGWLHTGDLGYIDSEGYLFVSGRKKNVIVTSSGRNVFPEELETYLLRSPYVSECAVVGIKREKSDEVDVVAVVHPNYAHAKEMLGVYASERMIRERIWEEVKRINGSVHAYKRIDMLITRQSELSKTRARKIKRSGLIDEIMDEYLLRRS